MTYNDLDDNAKELIKQLEFVVDAMDNYYSELGLHYESNTNLWENYGKSRLYLKIHRTRDHVKSEYNIDYGYYDNIAKQYFPHKYGNIKKKYQKVLNGDFND